MVVEAPVDRGIFAYMQAPVLLNSARLGLAAASATPLVYRVTSDSRYATSNAGAAVSPTACSIGLPDFANVLSLSAPCEVSLSQLQTGSASAIPLTVNYGNLATDLTFGVYSPGGLQISAADPMLNRIQDASGGLFESCSTGSVTAKDPNPPQALSSPPVRERVNS